ncbi:hypothetical protein PSDVSF_29040 [Pseudodesulfovibrio sediminis]|uniref:Tetratricopeptide repeat protein n=1 Tax=Pseudodesulfovibrio sediminis TaxID=2810563 RepID=A0ABM7P9D6_9BACT|nr:hypothetical protein PSDVSF_29040 [Pseudodesulfovibrio sediminis]
MAIRRGTTLRGHGQRHYWLIRQVGETTYGVRGVDGEFLPFGAESLIAEEELLGNYTPEVEVFEKQMLPLVRKHQFRLDESMDRSLSGMRDPLCVDEANVRGLFTLGMKYIQNRKTSRGRKCINELVRLESAYPGKNQYLFNEFGIKLRKIGFLEGAVVCYRRGLRFTSEDDHLYYNLARAYYEQGQWWDCMGVLSDCFEHNPALPLARNLVELIIALGDNPGLRARHGKSPVPEGVVRRAALLSEAVAEHEPDAELLMREREKRRAELQEEYLWLPGRDAVGM